MPMDAVPSCATTTGAIWSTAVMKLGKPSRRPSTRATACVTKTVYQVADPMATASNAAAPQTNRMVYEERTEDFCGSASRRRPGDGASLQRPRPAVCRDPLH